MRYVIGALLLTFSIGLGSGAFAQNSPPAGDDKKAISKSCSDQANAKGLHGRERRKFRSECKHKGGKMD